MSEGYPVSILPRAEYELEMTMPALIDDVADCYVQRRCDLPIEECCKDGNLGDVRHEALGDYLHGMSVNLLGGYFEKQHVRWRQSGKGAKYWKVQEDVRLSDYKDCYERHPYGHAIYFNASNVKELEFDVPCTVTDKQLRKKFGKALSAAFGPIEEKNIIHCKICLAHAPTMLNYWHAEIRQIVEGEKETTTVKKSDSGWQQKVVDTFRVKIRELATLREPASVTPIPRTHYIK